MGLNFLKVFDVDNDKKALEALLETGKGKLIEAGKELIVEAGNEVDGFEIKATVTVEFTRKPKS